MRPPFAKLLVANRGEIALRILRTARDLGIRTVAVYSQPDESSLHVRFADEAICIGPASPARSYLNIPAILTAAKLTGAEAVHPGYGFLAEDADFARAVRAMGMVFVGPAPEHLELFGDKLSAKRAARDAGIPLLAGSEGAVRGVAEAQQIAEEAGYPVLVKATAGGGGKGMRRVDSAEELARVFELTSAEALASFGRGDVFIERFLEAPRHIEVQVLGDGIDAIHLGTRECTLQRRHQKIIEEAPAPRLSAALRQGLQDAAVHLARSVGYRSLGTMEFLVQGDGFWFLEVNPRIQVEHPVTEEITGLDLVDEQLRIAAGGRLSLTQDQVVQRGHAIEVRVNAEHPWTFRASPGVITGYHEPGGPGIRVDSAVHEHASVLPWYDSLVAKVIAHGRSREQARMRMLRALEEVVVEGIDTSVPLQLELLRSEAFRLARVDTRTVDRWVSARASNG
ncbi:MAG: acetyl-CoA carboxylase biotin carboxylase subunit [Deltaproteobacteria bacterium]|nr:acetyl-CoA carboxylase biotin carboxylase subunit [Deltaproteobacteria bacterium]